MVEAAVAGVPGFDASAIEIDRGGLSYTVDTLEAFAASTRAPSAFCSSARIRSRRSTVARARAHRGAGPGGRAGARVRRRRRALAAATGDARRDHAARRSVLDRSARAACAPENDPWIRPGAVAAIIERAGLYR
jgi:hypothetical protein